jgi:hypothetical protein
VLLISAAILLLIGLALPWRVVTPLNDAAVSLMGSSTAGQRPISLFASPFSALLSGALCFPLAPVLASALLGIAGIGSLLRGRSPIPLHLVVAACMIGLAFVVPLLFMLGPFGFTRETPRFASTYTWGLWITLAGYLAAFTGCILPRRPRSRRPS